MRILDSKPALRWLAPLAVVLVVGTSGLVAATATADNKLPDRSAEQLLVDLQQAKVEGLSGTVVQQANLGIPAIPGAGGGDSTDPTSMLSGTHTMRVWYSGPDKARVALMGTYGETDLITNGTDVWTWSSKDQAATHRTLNSGEKAGDQKPAGEAPSGADVPKTPEEAAKWAIKALGPSTDISTASDVTVARQDAYELVLRPKDDRSLISEVRVAIDGATKLPLRVQAFGAGDTLVFEVAYTRVSFTKPGDDQFAFNPPAGTKVTEKATPERKAPTQAERDEAKQAHEQAANDTKTYGTGWTKVVVAKIPADSKQGDQLKAFVNQLTPVSGGWGSGRLLAGTAFSAVLTDDGRIAVGAVEPELLYEALAK
ncbi:MAG TPA: hypothetical protein VIT20_06130 [Propionibacteriaceae bacterium]